MYNDFRHWQHFHRGSFEDNHRYAGEDCGRGRRFGVFDVRHPLRGREAYFDAQNQFAADPIRAHSGRPMAPGELFMPIGT